MTKSLIVFVALATLAAHSIPASAESCPPTSRILMRITGDDSLHYLTSRTSLNAAEEALGTSWNADAAALAEQALRIAGLPKTPMPIESTIPVPGGSGVPVTTSSVTSVAIPSTATPVTSEAIPATSVSIVNQPASAATTLRFHPAINAIRVQ